MTTFLIITIGLLVAGMAWIAGLAYSKTGKGKPAPPGAPEPVVEMPADGPPGLSGVSPASPADRLLQERLRERFIVTTASGESFDGLLVEVDDRTVVMRDVSVLKADGAVTPVDGEVILRRDAVAYMQRP